MVIIYIIIILSLQQQPGSHELNIIVYKIKYQDIIILNVFRAFLNEKSQYL